MLNYPIWHRMTWFFATHTIMSVMIAVLLGGMLAMSWLLYAFIDWLIVGIVTFTHCGGPLGLGGYCWQNAVLFYVLAGHFAPMDGAPDSS
jgi:hypothetical protein